MEKRNPNQSLAALAIEHGPTGFFIVTALLIATRNGPAIRRYAEDVGLLIDQAKRLSNPDPSVLQRGPQEVGSHDDQMGLALGRRQVAAVRPPNALAKLGQRVRLRARQAKTALNAFFKFR
jgi:hypothetical protein